MNDGKKTLNGLDKTHPKMTERALALAHTIKTRLKVWRRLGMNVEELMSEDVKSCAPRQSLAEAAHLMWMRDCGCVPVTDSEGCVVGMITDRDICMAAYLKGKALHEMSVGESMSRKVLTCHPDDTIEAAEEAMRRSQVRRLPVTDDVGRLVGVLSLNDIAREAGREPSPRRIVEFGLHDVGLTLSAVSQQRGARPAPIA